MKKLPEERATYQKLFNPTQQMKRYLIWEAVNATLGRVEGRRKPEI